MAIAKKPGAKPAPSAPPSDEQAEKFISAAHKAAPAEEETKKAPVMIRFDQDLLKRVDTAAKRRGISRSAWVQYTLSRALDLGEG